MYLLDTNACIRILNGSSPAVAARLQATNPSDVRLCSVVKAELSTARAHDLVLVTHNAREFSRVPGLPVEDWEEASA